jgi:hypothetical protein
MDWTQVLAIVGSNMALFLWARAESRTDVRMMLGIIDGIQKEIKDFHGRLCSIEERNLRKDP